MYKTILRADRYYDTAAARVADEANVGAGETAVDRDSGYTWIRLTGGWWQMAYDARPADKWVTATAAVNTAATATLPAVAGMFHYITAIELIKLYAVVGVASGAGVIVTTTNLPGNPAFTTEQLAGAAGTAAKAIDKNFAGNPLKSAVAGTDTTFVAPQQLQSLWRWNIAYYIGA